MNIPFIEIAFGFVMALFAIIYPIYTSQRNQVKFSRDPVERWVHSCLLPLMLFLVEGLLGCGYHIADCVQTYVKSNVWKFEWKNLIVAFMIGGLLGIALGFTILMLWQILRYLWIYLSLNYFLLPFLGKPRTKTKKEERQDYRDPE